jgi:hypothetical protein
LLRLELGSPEGHDLSRSQLFRLDDRREIVQKDSSEDDCLVAIKQYAVLDMPAHGA